MEVSKIYTVGKKVAQPSPNPLKYGSGICHKLLMRDDKGVMNQLLIPVEYSYLLSGNRDEANLQWGKMPVEWQKQRFQELSKINFHTANNISDLIANGVSNITKRQITRLPAPDQLSSLIGHRTPAGSTLSPLEALELLQPGDLDILDTVESIPHLNQLPGNIGRILQLIRHQSDPGRSTGEGFDCCRWRHPVLPRWH